MMTALMSLSVHYYRPDFTEGQARVLIRDMLEDLAEFTPEQVDAAIRAYRRDPKSKFFPTSGQLREKAAECRKEQIENARTSGKRKAIPEFGDSRPILWWTQMPYLWRPHWKEADIPEEWRDSFRHRLALKRKSGVEGWGENDFYGLHRKYQSKLNHK